MEAGCRGLEWIGCLSLFVLVCYSSYPGKVRKLENKVKKLERKQSGGGQMSKIIRELIGKDCNITTEEALLWSGSTQIACKVLDADDEWVKFTYCDRKNAVKTKILRIDSIDHIELAEE